MFGIRNIIWGVALKWLVPAGPACLFAVVIFAYSHRKLLSQRRTYNWQWEANDSWPRAWSQGDLRVRRWLQVRRLRSHGAKSNETLRSGQRHRRSLGFAWYTAMRWYGSRHRRFSPVWHSLIESRNKFILHLCNRSAFTETLKRLTFNRITFKNDMYLTTRCFCHAWGKCAWGIYWMSRSKCFTNWFYTHGRGNVHVIGMSRLETDSRNSKLICFKLSLYFFTSKILYRTSFTVPCVLLPYLR